MGVSLLIFDIDGVLTDGSICIDDNGHERKSYNLTEIDALNDLRQDGYKLAAITGEDKPIVDVFQRLVSWDAFLRNCKDKVAGIKQMEEQLSVGASEICYIGDGKYDVPAIRYAGLGVAPANAIEEAKDAADIVLERGGGKNCINELRRLLQKIPVQEKGGQTVLVKNSENKGVGGIRTAMDKFMIPGRVVIITGGAGLMGYNHAEAVLSGGGVPVLLDISEDALVFAKQRLLERFPTGEVVTYRADITDRAALETVRGELLKKYGHIDALINNAANNPKMEGNAKNMGAITFENFPLAMWAADITVGLTGSLLCSQVFGAQMAKQRSGAILNISSDLGVIAPDQRIYRKPGLRDEEQTVKPVTYSVIKHGLIGLTKYVATYWAEKSVRCNALCPAGVENGQDEGFIRKLTNLVPMGRMATKDEYQSTVLYMISDASAYMTGATVIVDGGRTCW
jgi:YrbI family 3-deoxy-D-manno-octulosonate 8-phosphate phosphatase